MTTSAELRRPSLPVRPGEGALFLAEKLGLDYGPADGCAPVEKVQVDKKTGWFRNLSS